jgi:endonuclease III
VTPARTRAPAFEPPTRRTVREIHRRLARRFGPLDPPRRWDPVEELVYTVLSQNTSDVNSGRAFAALKERFPTWDELARARPAQVAATIRPGGLANIKAPRILAIVREIRHRDGTVNLDWMHEASDREVADYLLSLPGVGPKTAACVLAFSLQRPALPVDTHVHRVAGRLGFLPPGTSAAAAHAIMEGLVPPELRVTMHVGMIRLGRQICRPGRPLCETCPLAGLCPTAPIVLGRATIAGAKRRSRRAAS